MEEHRSAEGRTTVASSELLIAEEDGSTRAAVLAPTQAGAARRAAILDSDKGFLLVLGKRLERAGWRHEVLPKKISRRTMSEMEIDALVVDVELLGAERLKWIEQICAERPDVSVIVCTASSTVAERVRALRQGVDDWLAKPCHPEELLARMEAAVKRRGAHARDMTPLLLGEVEVRPDQYQAFVGETSLGLTRREYQLIELFSAAQGEVLPRQRIYECLWGYEMVRNDRSVDVFVHKLRRKLERGSPGWSYIHTHFGVGYRLAPECAETSETVLEPLAA